MLKDKRKLFTITEVYDPNFLFPGSTLPGVGAPILEEPKVFEGKTYNVGSMDPEWVEPDINNIHIGNYAGRFWYSIRDDISTDISTLGNFTANIDPKVVNTVNLEEFNYFATCPFIKESMHLVLQVVEPTKDDIANSLITLGVVLDPSVNIADTVLYKTV
jgi:hypothetical protein